MKVEGSKNPPAHIKKALTQLKEDVFTFSTGSPPSPIRSDLTSTQVPNRWKKRNEVRKTKEKRRLKKEKKKRDADKLKWRRKISKER